jgi:hypothetical protein
VRGRLRHVLTIIYAAVAVQCSVRCHLARRAVGRSVQAYLCACSCTSIQTVWRQRQARLLFRMQVRVVLLYHSSCCLQRVYRGHLQRLAFATALRTGCFTTVSDSQHDKAARRARDVKAAGVAVARGVRPATARAQKMKAVVSGAAEQGAEGHAGRCLDRAPWPPSAAQALACLRLLRYPGPRLLKRPGKLQKERAQLAGRILSSAPSAAAAAPDAPHTQVASIGISVVSCCVRLQLQAPPSP